MVDKRPYRESVAVAARSVYLPYGLKFALRGLDMEAWYCCFRSVNSRALRLVVRYLNIKVTTVCCIFDPAILFCHRCCLITVICSRSGLMDEMVFSLQCWLANTFDSCSQRNLTFVFLKVFSVILRTFW